MSNKRLEIKTLLSEKTSDNRKSLESRGGTRENDADVSRGSEREKKTRVQKISNENQRDNWRYLEVLPHEDGIIWQCGVIWASLLSGRQVCLHSRQWASVLLENKPQNTRNQPKPKQQKTQTRNRVEGYCTLNETFTCLKWHYTWEGSWCTLWCRYWLVWCVWSTGSSAGCKGRSCNVSLLQRESFSIMGDSLGPLPPGGKGGIPGQRRPSWSVQQTPQ